VKKQVAMGTPDAIIGLIAKQLDRAENASERIEREGLVVRDMKGSVVAHPAIAVEASATKQAADLLEKHRSKY